MTTTDGGSQAEQGVLGVAEAAEALAPYVEFAEFRRAVRTALYAFWPNNPGVSDNEIIDAIAALRAQRDELLAALEALVREGACAAACLEKIGRKDSSWEGYTSTTALQAALDAARAAIAAAGGAS